MREVAALVGFTRFEFARSAVEFWFARPAVRQRGQQLNAGFDCWCQEHLGTHRKFSGLPYLMLHSFAHLLLTTIALECGYPASAIRERIYTLPNLGYGVLLYTGTTDAEGTLGGLIQVGRHYSTSTYAMPWPWANCAPMIRSARSTFRRACTNTGFSMERPAMAVC